MNEFTFYLLFGFFALFVGGMIAFNMLCKLLQSARGTYFLGNPNQGYGYSPPMVEAAPRNRSFSGFLFLIVLAILSAFILYTINNAKGGSSDHGTNRVSNEEKFVSLNVSPLKLFLEGNNDHQEAVSKQRPERDHIDDYTSAELPAMRNYDSNTEGSEMENRETVIALRAVPVEKFFIQMKAANDFFKSKEEALLIEKNFEKGTILLAAIMSESGHSMAYKIVCGQFDSKEEASSYLTDNKKLFPEGSWVRSSLEFHELYSLSE